MKKILSIFAASLVALAVSAQTDFAAPGYSCAADDAVLTGGSGNFTLNTELDPHQIQWSDVGLSSNALATWTITATRGCYVTVSLDLGPVIASNKHIFEVKILDDKSNVKGTLAEPAENADADQVKALDGTILIPVAGTYTVELRNNRDWGKGRIKNVILTYDSDAPSEIIDVTSVELNKAELALQVEEVEQLSATVLPNDATDPSVTWSSDDEAVATVSEDGFVTAIAIGTANIKAKAGDVEAICAVTVSAIAVPEVELTSTYTLSAKTAHLEGAVWKMYDEDVYKLYGDGGHNAHYGNAFWTIKVTNPCFISGTISGIGGGSLYELDVFKGEDSITTIIQPVGSKWWSGNVDMEGTILLAEAGEYTFRLRNTLEWSSGKTTGVMLSYIADAKTLYCYVDKAWWKDGDAAVNCYAKVQDGPDNTWPGVAMTQVEENLWKVVIPGNYNRMNFVRTNPDQDTYWGAKTDEMNVPENNYLFTITSDDAQWDDQGKTAQGYWAKYGLKFKISGSMTDWSPNIDSYEDSYVLDLEAGNYQLKVVTPDNQWLGYNVLTEEYKVAELYPNEDGNVCFTLAAAGKVTVTYIKDGVYKLEGAFVPAEVKLIGIAGWNAETDAIAMTPADDHLTTSVTLNLDQWYYEFKVLMAGAWLGKENGESRYEIKNDWNWVDGLTYAGDNIIIRLGEGDIVPGSYTFTWNYAEGKMEVTFPKVPAAIDNTNAAVKVVKMIENGQMIIIKNGVKFNAQGAIVR